MDYGIAKIVLRTPVSVGKTGNFPVLDSVLMHRLGLLFSGDVGLARQHMPLARHEDSLWLCGGGYDPGSLPGGSVQSYKVYRRLANDATLSARMGCPPREIYSQITRMFGQETVATEWAYDISPLASEMHFRFQGDIERVERLLRLEPFIGPGHSVGLGEIDSITVEPADGDLLWVMTDPRGRLTRPLPMDFGRSLEIETGLSEVTAVEAPYWSAQTARVYAMRPLPVRL